MIYMLTPDNFESWLLGKPIYKPNIDQSNKHFVVSLSGGKDSTALLLKLIEYNAFIHEVVFVDTGEEMPEMYSHIKKLKKIVLKNNIEFTTIRPPKNFGYYLGDHVKTRGKNRGKKGYGWPDFQNRWCTKHLKIEPLKKYYRDTLREKYDSVEFIGIALDEAHRAEKNDDGRIKEHPLINFDIKENDALQYCYQRGFDWGGLYEKFGRVSCYLCPLSTIKKLKYIYQKHPNLWKNMKALDKKSWRSFRSDYTLLELEARFKAEERQQKLFLEEENLCHTH